MNKTNLCDTCQNKMDFPNCIPEDVEFGEETEDDNIIGCTSYISKII